MYLQNIHLVLLSISSILLNHVHLSGEMNILLPGALILDGELNKEDAGFFSLEY